MRFRRTRKEQNRNVVVVGQFCGIYSYFHTSCLGVADIHTRVGLRVLRHSSGQHHEFAVRSLLKGSTDSFILVIWMQNCTASYIYLAKATANRPSVGFYRRGWLQRWGGGGDTVVIVADEEDMGSHHTSVGSVGSRVRESCWWFSRSCDRIAATSVCYSTNTTKTIAIFATHVRPPCSSQGCSKGFGSIQAND